MEYPQPRDRSRGKQRNYPWVFKISEDFIYQSNITGKDFHSHWLHLEQSGRITIKAHEQGYAWDGCSPKWSLLGLAIIGIPDGHIHIATEKPKAYYASLVHDAFYQYLEHVPVSKADIDRLFYNMLKQTAFPLARFYYLAVFWFGGRSVTQKNV